MIIFKSKLPQVHHKIFNTKLPLYHFPPKFDYFTKNSYIFLYDSARGRICIKNNFLEDIVTTEKVSKN